MEKSYVSLEKKICPVCGKEHNFDCGILLDRRIANSLEKETITGYGYCEEHAAMVKEGYYFLLEIDPSKSVVSSSNTVKPEDAYRTGVVISVRENVLDALGIPKPHTSNRILYIDHAVTELMEKMQANSEGESDVHDPGK